MDRTEGELLHQLLRRRAWRAKGVFFLGGEGEGEVVGKTLRKYLLTKLSLHNGIIIEKNIPKSKLDLFG